MRCLLLAMLLPGCVAPFAISLTPETAIDTFLVVAPHGGKGEERAQEPPPPPPSPRELRDREVIRRARMLTSSAVTAARRGDCGQVIAIQRAVLQLPEVQLEGGVHDVIFLREPAIVRCLAKTATGPA